MTRDSIPRHFARSKAPAPGLLTTSSRTSAPGISASTRASKFEPPPDARTPIPILSIKPILSNPFFIPPGEAEQHVGAFPPERRSPVQVDLESFHPVHG